MILLIPDTVKMNDSGFLGIFLKFGVRVESEKKQMSDIQADAQTAVVDNILDLVKGYERVSTENRFAVTPVSKILLILSRSRFRRFSEMLLPGPVPPRWKWRV